MEIPGTEAELVRFTQDIIHQCEVSRDARRMLYKAFRTLYYTGTINGVPSKNNKCFSHIDKLSSYLFSPVDVRFDLDLENGNPDGWTQKLGAGARYLNKRFTRAGCGLAFGQAVEQSLIDGVALTKLVWGPKGYAPWVIKPEFFGVLREDIADLDRQEAFTHTFYVLPDSLRRMLGNRPGAAELLERAKASASPNAQAEIQDSYLHEMVSGGQIGAQNLTSPAPSYSVVGVVATPAPMLDPDVAADLIRVDDVWVWNDKLEDWTTIRYIDPGIIVEGLFRHRNLSDARKRHPFTKVQSSATLNYFWGRSELAVVTAAQGVLTDRLNDVDAIFRLQSKPPRAMSGFQGVTEEKARALLMPGGALIEGAVGAKVENLAPDMPANAMELLAYYAEVFNETAGFTNVLSGQGEPGIRAGVHAGTLLRTSSARLMDRALMVEHQASEFADLCLNMSRNKDPTVITAGEGEQFMLDQLPGDTYAAVDSHSSSPAFAEDNKQLLFALAKAGAIGPEDLIEGTQPPRQDVLLYNLKVRQKAEAEMLAKNPEALEKMQGKKKR